jgi:hypothetical protein
MTTARVVPEDVVDGMWGHGPDSKLGQKREACWLAHGNVWGDEGLCGVDVASRASPGRGTYLSCKLKAWIEEFILQATRSHRVPLHDAHGRIRLYRR